MASPKRDLEALAAALTAQKGRRLPPVSQWNPPDRGDLDMRIARDGTWYYLGSSINRPAMVRLFSTVLRRDEDDRHYLVTPVERFAIAVDDAPFVALELYVEGAGADQVLTFRTQVDDYVRADAAHPIRVDIDPRTAEPAPYLLVRDRLEALISRSVFYELVELAVDREIDGLSMLGVCSAGCFFVIGPNPENE